MHNPFWRMMRTTSLILPYTRDFYDVSDGDGSKNPAFNTIHDVAYFKKPRVTLSHSARQVLEICGAPWAIQCCNIIDIKGKFKVHYSAVDFQNTSMEQHSIDCQNKVLTDIQPYILVRAKDFIVIDKAFDDYIIRLEAKKAKDDLENT